MDKGLKFPFILVSLLMGIAAGMSIAVIGGSLPEIIIASLVASDFALNLFKTMLE